jgi:hypothetical protein
MPPHKYVFSPLESHIGNRLPHIQTLSAFAGNRIFRKQIRSFDPRSPRNVGTQCNWGVGTIARTR